MTLSESLRQLADHVQDWEGKLSIHSHKVTSEAELKAWTKFLTNLNVRVGDRHFSDPYVYGDLGPIRIFVNYERGLLGEVPVPKPEPPPEPNSEESLKRLQELLS